MRGEDESSGSNDGQRRVSTVELERGSRDGPSKSVMNCGATKDDQIYPSQPYLSLACSLLTVFAPELRADGR